LVAEIRPWAAAPTSMSRAGNARFPRASPARASKAGVGASRSFATAKSVNTPWKSRIMPAKALSAAGRPGNGGAPDGMSILCANVAREHVPNTAASESTSLIGMHGPGCPETTGEGEEKVRKQQQRTGGSCSDREWCRTAAAQGRDGEWRLGSQPRSVPRSGRKSHTCRLWHALRVPIR